jgi:hypothetical protein
VNLPGSVNLRVRPERGLDLAAASFRGVAIAWTTELGEVPGVPGDWWASWGGGLMTTCGLDNVGAPSDGRPMHGTYTYRAARDVRQDGGEVRGTIADARGLTVDRRIENLSGGGRILVEDVAVNNSEEPLEAPLLYHCNLRFGPVDVDSDEVVPRDADAAAADWRELGSGPERVYEHLGATEAAVDVEGVRVRIRSSLPRLWQWVDPGLGVVGIEPANCSVLGAAHDRAEGRLPVLEPGEERRTTLEIEMEKL